MKSTTFSLEISGLDLPEKARVDISKALNATLEKEIGSLDLAGGDAPRTKEEAARRPGFEYFLINHPNGGRFIRLETGIDVLNTHIKDAVNDPKTMGFSAMVR